jgi:hypothetical protein
LQEIHFIFVMILQVEKLGIGGLIKVVFVLLLKERNVELNC